MTLWRRDEDERGSTSVTRARRWWRCGARRCARSGRARTVAARRRRRATARASGRRVGRGTGASTPARARERTAGEGRRRGHPDVTREECSSSGKGAAGRSSCRCHRCCRRRRPPLPRRSRRLRSGACFERIRALSPQAARGSCRGAGGGAAGVDAALWQPRLPLFFDTHARHFARHAACRAPMLAYIAARRVVSDDGADGVAVCRDCLRCSRVIPIDAASRRRRALQPSHPPTVSRFRRPFVDAWVAQLNTSAPPAAQRPPWAIRGPIRASRDGGPDRAHAARAAIGTGLRRRVGAFDLAAARTSFGRWRKVEPASFPRVWRATRSRFRSRSSEWRQSRARRVASGANTATRRRTRPVPDTTPESHCRARVMAPPAVRRPRAAATRHFAAMRRWRPALPMPPLMRRRRRRRRRWRRLRRRRCCARSSAPRSRRHATTRRCHSICARAAGCGTSQRLRLW